MDMKFNKGKCRVQNLGRIIACILTGWGLTYWKGEKDLDVLVAMNQQFTFVNKKADGILGSIKKNTASRSSEVIYSALVRLHRIIES